MEGFLLLGPLESGNKLYSYSRETTFQYLLGWGKAQWEAPTQGQQEGQTMPFICTLSLHQIAVGL